MLPPFLAEGEVIRLNNVTIYHSLSSTLDLCGETQEQMRRERHLEKQRYSVHEEHV